MDEDEPQVVAAPEAAAPATPPATPEPGPGPWSSDLAQYIEDETARAGADRYIRERLQPRITELEEGSADARALWNDLVADPQQTLTAVIADIYGDDVAERLAQVFPGEEETIVDTNEPAPAELPQHIQEMYEQFTADQQQRAYDVELGRIKEANPTLEEEFFHPFVVTAQGDFDQALAAYKTWEGRVAERFGQPAPTEDAPAVVGTGGQGNPVPPTSKQYGSIAEALEDTLADIRRSAPSTVGGV